MNGNKTKTTLTLLLEYIESKSYVISETSGNMSEDYKTLIDDAREYADILGIIWQDDFIPQHVIDCANNYYLEN